MNDLRCLAKPRSAITITLPDGTVKEGTAWETTPYMIAEVILFPRLSYWNKQINSFRIQDHTFLNQL